MGNSAFFSDWGATHGSSCVGVSSHDVLGLLVSSRDVQVGFSLVTMCG